MTSIRSNPLVSRRLTRLFCLAAFLILAFSAGSAQAQDEEKTQDPDRLIPYIEYTAGVSIVPNQTLKGKGGTGAGLMGSARPDTPGYFVGGALGAKFLQYFRSELQIGYRSTDVQNISVQGEAAGTSGDLGLLSIMANGYFEMEVAEGFSPFVGFGIGWGMPRLDAENKPTDQQLSIDDTDSVFVFNAMAGGSYAISDVTDISLGYRYIRTEDISYKSTIKTGPDPDDLRAQRMDFEYDAHEVYVGLRFNF